MDVDQSTRSMTEARHLPHQGRPRPKRLRQPVQSTKALKTERWARSCVEVEEAGEYDLWGRVV